ncbi:MAG: arginine--tRNA ligase [Acidilobaceae archaeon]|nr:arginine--tRNA ligase [Acidilobaceae archaeon]MDW7973935.1 arginine--tRNA ligase [Sulfolobales archaeon]
MQGGPLVQALLRVGRCLEDKTGVPLDSFVKLLSKTPREEYGDFGFPLARFFGRAEQVLPEVQQCVSIDYVSLSLWNGFLNVKLDERGLGRELFELMKGGWRPEPLKTETPRRIVVEHTSANPVHPLHIGHARNASLGDCLARMLKARGNDVVVRYYVNDVGRQVSVVVLGFSLLGIEPEELSTRLGTKIDHAIGWVYAVTHTAIDAVMARRRGDQEEAERLAAQLVKLRERGDASLADLIIERVSSLENPEAKLSEIMSRYEAGLEPERSKVRALSQAALEGFMETLGRMGIGYDSIDWESDVVWSGLLAAVLSKARESPYLTKHKEALALDLMRIVRERVGEKERERLRLPKGFEVPPMILFRSDGTTLYWTRDIAYSIYKFSDSKADQVINVIASEQRLPQLQIRIALLGLGYEREGLNMLHYEYEIVRLPGRAMSGRRGEYVTLDELIDEAKERAAKEAALRNPDLSKEELESIAEGIAVGAIRFSLVQPGATKSITFDVERVLRLEENTGPYLQYTHARAHNILEKHGQVKYELAEPEVFSERDRRSLLIHALLYPMVAAKAADELRPEDLASYLLKLADLFNKWYQKDSVIREPNAGLREGKAAMVQLVSQVLGSGLSLLGVPPLKRM